jgi:hypothetical protein
MIGSPRLMNKPIAINFLKLSGLKGSLKLAGDIIF